MVRRSTPGAYSFAATQLSPGFDYADFEIGYRDDLVRRYPAFAREIERLTRAEFLLRPVSAPGAAAPVALARPKRLFG